jgi:hypothetical protein
LAAKHQFRDIKVSPAYTEEERRAIARDLVSYIRDRTKEGKGPGGKEWSGGAGKYSDEYKKSLEFKIAGKDSTVDLTLSGDMLDSMDVLSTEGNKIRIGFENGSDENARADGNIRGTYGQDRPIPGKARPFLDLTPDEVKAVLEKYPLDNAEVRSFRSTIVNAVTNFQGEAVDIFTDDDE